MKANLTNLKFEYLYRDAGNYKQFGSMVFENPSGITAEEATELIRSKLIDGQYFESSKGDVPIIHVYAYHPDLDHGWYEFEQLSETAEVSKPQREFDEFIKDFGV